MANLSEELIAKFKSGLSSKIKSELDSHNFEFIPAANAWLDSVVDYYLDHIKNDLDEDDISCFMSTLDDYKREEDDSFAWPSTTAASIIIARAFADDRERLEYITMVQYASISPVNCFKADWFWDSSMRPEVLDWIDNFLIENL